MTNTDARLWIREFHPAPHSPVQLVCFPHAGGSAVFYFPVSAALQPSVNVQAVQYPGRQDRSREPFVPTVTELADVVAGILLARNDERRIALFGHSMGAVVAYEVARRLEAAGTTPLRLFVSGRRAPSRTRDESVHERSDQGVIAELRRLNGTQSAIFSDDEIVRMILPAVRNDYRAIETYTHPAGQVLSCPITALVGDSDPMTTLDETDAWQAHTSGEFERRVFPGGHFYLAAQSSAVIKLISDFLVPNRADRPPLRGAAG